MPAPSPRRSGFGRAGGSSPAMTTQSVAPSCDHHRSSHPRSFRCADLHGARPGPTIARGIVHVLHIGLRQHVFAGRDRAHDIGDGEHRLGIRGAIERGYYTLDGKPADISKAKQNDRFAVVLKITEAKPEYGHIMVSDYLPAGLEIDNPHLVSSGDSGTLDWIEDGEEPEDTEFRDDRFTAAIDRASDSKSVFTVAYVVRAFSPGKYVLPQAYAEDMYNPSRYGRTGTGVAEVRAAK